MRSAPSLERGRFVLPRDFTAAVATAATLIVAVVVVGWLSAGLITGVWSPAEQAASVTHGAVTLATPSERDAAPRTRVAVTHDRPVAAPRRTVPAPVAVPRRQAPRRARRQAAAKPAPAAPAPVVVPALTPAPVATTVPVAAVTESSVAPADKTTNGTSQRQATQVSTNATSQRQATQVSTTTTSWGDDDDDRRSASDHNGRSWTRPRGRDRHRSEVAQPVPTSVPTPVPADDHDDFDVQDSWHRARGEGRHNGWDRGRGR